MNSINQIVQEIAQLPEDQRFTLVNRILTLSEPLISDDIAYAWNQEIRDRIDRYDRGEASSRPASEVFSELDRRLKL